jgi:hypothetical protein
MFHIMATSETNLLSATSNQANKVENDDDDDICDNWEQLDYCVTRPVLIIFNLITNPKNNDLLQNKPKFTRKSNKIGWGFQQKITSLSYFHYKIRAIVLSIMLVFFAIYYCSHGYRLIKILKVLEKRLQTIKLESNSKHEENNITK